MPEAREESVRLVRATAAGDREAFGRLYDRFSGLVFTVAVRLLRSRADAEDLLQEVFLQVWRQAESYDETRGTPEAWVLTIARSRGIDKLRSIRRRGETMQPIETEPGGGPELASVESGAAGAEARVVAGRALGGLPAAQREVLELAYFEGLTQTEIAVRLGQPLGTVKTRMRSGLERLRAAVGGTPGPGEE
jgi:RNA polymerase sigma-70 factor (ECF subfamily)